MARPPTAPAVHPSRRGDADAASRHYLRLSVEITPSSLPTRRPSSSLHKIYTIEYNIYIFMYIRCIITLYTILSTKMDRPSRRFRAVQTSQLQRITLSVQVERDVDSRFFYYIYIVFFHFHHGIVKNTF